MMKSTILSHGKLKDRVLSVLKYVFLSLFALMDLVPFYWILISAFKDNNEILTAPLALPKSWIFSNITSAWESAHVNVYFLNTLFVSVISVAVVLIVTSMAAFVLARVMPSRGLYTYYLLGLMIPAHAILVPIFIILSKLHLVNTFLSLILTYIAVGIPLSTFILYGFMQGLPKELEEAAAIDGCGLGRVYLQIIMPLTLPGLSTVGILTFLNCWNEFLLPLVLITDDSKKMIAQGINDLKGMYSTDFGLLTAGILLSVIPTILIYILFQEQVVKGLTAGAVKG